jgi:flavin reductase (DIM6/NTAB) family NADH-FMN oxidoreductase RutF
VAGALPAEVVGKAEFRAVMGSFAASVTVVTTIDVDGTPHALTATAFSSLSQEPPLCLVCVNRGSRAHEPMRVGRRFAVNMLAAGQEAVSARFAKPGPDKFAGVDWSAGPTTGCPLLPDALAWLECEVTEIFAGGDHDIFVGRLLSTRVREGAPLVYFRGRYATLA